ncbi:MAG: hypothetical protein AVDCRST_MAG73-1792, partial [uncultured Thermomicrobiales bacterium]
AQTRTGWEARIGGNGDGPAHALRDRDRGGRGRPDHRLGGL